MKLAKRLIPALLFACAVIAFAWAQSNTANLSIKKPQSGQGQPLVTLAEGFDSFDLAVAGKLSKSLAAGDVTLTTAEGRYAVLELTGTLTANRNLVVPAKSKLYLVINSTSGSFTATVKTASGTGVAVAQGRRAFLYSDGTNVVAAGAMTAGRIPYVASDGQLSDNNKFLYDPATNLFSITDGVGTAGFRLSAGGVVPGYGALFTTPDTPSVTNFTLGSSNIDTLLNAPAANGIIYFRAGGTDLGTWKRNVSPNLTLLSGGAAHVPLRINSAAGPTADILQVTVNGGVAAGGYFGVASGGTQFSPAAAQTGSAGGTTTLNLANGNFHDVTMPAGNTTIALSNLPHSAIIVITIIQDATGGRTVTWPAAIKWAGGAAPALTAAANARDQFTFRSNGTSLFEMSRALDVK
jgi:hypothetical protein